MSVGRTAEPPPQRYLSAACEIALDRYGDSHRGVGYTRSSEEAEDRYALMLDVVRERDEPVTVLDLGCGLAHMLDHIQRDPRRRHIRYTGADISPRYLDAARSRHPDANLLRLDLLADTGVPDFDYVILNGLFNSRGEIEQGRMVDYWKRLVAAAYDHSRRGLAFNVMTKLVDWERDDLFHLPFDEMAGFVGRALSRHFVIRHDYWAYEYTTYVYREPTSR